MTLAFAPSLSDVENKTEVVYSLLRDGEYSEAASLLQAEVQRYGDCAATPRSVLSLLAHCQFALCQFDDAAAVYGELSVRVATYRKYQATALWKAGRRREAHRAAALIPAKQVSNYVGSAIHFEAGDLDATDARLSEMEDCIESAVAKGCVAFFRGELQSALSIWKQCQKDFGYDKALYYNLAAVCFELGVATESEDLLDESRTYLRQLQGSGLVEAQWLEFAFRFREAQQNEMQVTDCESLVESGDAIGRHNSALLAATRSVGGGVSALRKVLRADDCPKVALRNCVVLCVENGLIDAAKDLLAEFGEDYDCESDSGWQLTVASLNGTLRALQSEAVAAKDASLFGGAVLRQCATEWGKHKLAKAESLLRAAKRVADESGFEFESPLNEAHIAFAKGQFQECVETYESLLAESNAMLVANLCVCYVMCGRNSEAEALIESVDGAEAKCVVNLAIGTLYCTQSNFHFGLSQICDALRSAPLTHDCWFHAKSAFLALAARVASHSVLRTESTLGIGLLKQTLFPLLDAVIYKRKHAEKEIRIEARVLKHLFLSLLFQY